MCEEEVRLNRRLCPDAYIGVVSVTRDGTRDRMGGAGETVEYAVKMRRIPHDRTMPVLVDRGAVDARQVRAVAHTIAAFHRDAETGKRIARFGRVEAVALNWRENFDQVAPYVGRTIARDRYDTVRAYVEAFLHDHAALIKQRADEGRVRDCHGDLRTDAIVLRDDGSVCIMDCIEFSDRIRYGDVAGDIGFLAMDLDFRNRRDLADELIAAYLSEAGDETLPLVLNFYRCYRAFVRGKVESFLLDEPDVPESQGELARTEATAHFALAHEYATRRYPRTLVLMAGLSGTGKSYVANAVAGRLGAAAVSSDVVRKRRLGVDLCARLAAPYGAGAYTEDERRRVYDAMLERAREHVAAGRSVILDATYSRRADRDAARALAAELHVALLAVEVTADESTVRRHLDGRAAAAATASDAGWQIYLEQRARFEPLDEFAAEQLLRIDSARPLHETVARIVAAIKDAKDPLP